MNKDLTKINFPIRRRTRVQFIDTSVKFGERDGEIDVTITAQIQWEKMGYEPDVLIDRFPFVLPDGTFKVTGKAVCGDEPFDYDKGKRIAETRAQQKVYSVAERIFEELINEYEEELKWLTYFKRNCSECKKDSEKHILELDNND